MPKFKGTKDDSDGGKSNPIVQTKKISIMEIIASSSANLLRDSVFTSSEILQTDDLNLDLEFELAIDFYNLEVQAMTFADAILNNREVDKKRFLGTKDNTWFNKLYRTYIYSFCKSLIQGSNAVGQRQGSSASLVFYGHGFLFNTMQNPLDTQCIQDYYITRKFVVDREYITKVIAAIIVRWDFIKISLQDNMFGEKVVYNSEFERYMNEMDAYSFINTVNIYDNSLYTEFLDSKNALGNACLASDYSCWYYIQGSNDITTDDPSYNINIANFICLKGSATYGKLNEPVYKKLTYNRRVVRMNQYLVYSITGVKVRNVASKHVSEDKFNTFFKEPLISRRSVLDDGTYYYVTSLAEELMKHRFDKGDNDPDDKSPST